MLDFLRGPIGDRAWPVAVVAGDRLGRRCRPTAPSGASARAACSTSSARWSSRALIAFVVQLWVIKPYRMPSPSMVRTLRRRRPRDRGPVLVPLRAIPKRGDIIVFHPNGIGDVAEQSEPRRASVTFVKRLIGMPGEWIQARGGHVQVCTGPAAEAAAGR